MQDQNRTSGVLIGDRDAQAGVSGTPKVADILTARHEPANPFFTLE
jgi:hypothetical protein